MKRLIKYWNQYDSDGAKFSDCSTNYEVLPELVDDTAGNAELKALALKHGIRLGRKIMGGLHGGKITHALNTMETKERRGLGKKELATVFVGFITVDTRGPLKPVKRVNTTVTDEQAEEVVNCQAYGVADVGENVDGKQTLVKNGWEYFHEMRLLGYSIESFEKALNIEDSGFEDDTYRCSDCGILDSADNGYTHNFRVMGCELLGVNCGCYDEAVKANFEEEFANNPDMAMELGAAKDLEKEGKIKRLETFIGGWTDGRGGYIYGKSTREGTPANVLKEYSEKNPKKKFVFVRDDSGQFQTYFSIWEIKGGGKKNTDRQSNSRK